MDPEELKLRAREHEYIIKNRSFETLASNYLKLFFDVSKLYKRLFDILISTIGFVSLVPYLFFCYYFGFIANQGKPFSFNCVQVKMEF
jgi:lipopolysaccharide/colanic/teichoic acid biosynthesis glycosyltransferase